MCLVLGSNVTYAESPADPAFQYVDGMKRRCIERGKEHFEDVKRGHYLAPTFQELSTSGEGKVTEQQLLAELRQDTKEAQLVLARGGLGKSRLAQSLHANLCADGPVFLLDLAAEPFPPAKARWSPEGWLLERIAVHARLSPSTKERVRFFYRLRDRPFYLIIDALDEVNQRQRAAVLHALNGLRRDFPDSLRLVILLRPTLYTEIAAIKGPQRALRLNPLECDVTKRFLGVFSKGAKGSWDKFLKDLGLDAQVGGKAKSCHYPHMATFRDIKMIARWAPASGFDGAKIRSWNPNYKPNRHEVYQTNAALTLGKAWPNATPKDRKRRLRWP